MLQDDGWTILYDVKNAKNNGIDIVAVSPNNEHIGFFEVKASFTGDIPDLSSYQPKTQGLKPQKMGKEYIESRLRYAGDGNYHNKMAEEVANRILEDWEKNGSLNTTYTVIGVDFSTDQIHVSRW